MMRLGTIAAVAALLSGCAATSSSVRAIRLPAYTTAEQHEMATMLPTLPTLAQRFIEDYGDVRAQVRAAQ